MSVDKEWFERKAALEDGQEIGAGRRLFSTVEELEQVAFNALPEWARKEILAYRTAEPVSETKPEDKIHYYWIIYERPLDYPNGYAARLWVRPVGFDQPINSEITIKCDTLEEVREALTINKVKWFMNRNESDHQTIVEIWE